MLEILGRGLGEKGEWIKVRGFGFDNAVNLHPAKVPVQH
jgi:hypothetical protein